MNKKKVFEPSDDTPVEWPIGVKTPETLEQKIARMVRTSVSLHAASQGAETFDEANDFDVDDPDGLPDSPHELDADQESLDAEMARDRQYRAVDPQLLRQLQAKKNRDKPGGDGGRAPHAEQDPSPTPPPAKDADVAAQ